MPRLLVSRSQLRPQLNERERRLQLVTTMVLRGIRQLMTPQELRIASAIGSVHPDQLTARVAGVWERHRPALIAALADPVRVRKAADPEPQPDPTPVSENLLQALAEAQVGRMIRELSPRQLAAVQAQLRALMQLGPSPAILEGIGAATGLTGIQVARVAQYLKRQREADVPEAVAVRTAKTYADSLLAQRAGTIARYEAVTYTNTLVHQRGLQLNGGKSITKSWVSARDLRVDHGRPNGICRVLDDGKRIPLEQAWIFDGEQYMSPPGHIGCRCLEEIWDETA
jgi:hypothetical protein